MPTIILKKTFKSIPAVGAGGYEKSFSFHGGISKPMIVEINQTLQRIDVGDTCLTPNFKLDERGHYYGKMNHDSQKYNEEDYVVAIIDVMEKFGYTFRFQYDTKIQSGIVADSNTSRELFLFQTDRTETNVEC